MIRKMSTALVLCLVLCLMPTAAAAQIGGAATADLAAPQPSQGPMVVERVHNGFLFAPDFKITEVDHKTSGIVGGYAGVVIADAFFIGGGGYGLVTDTHGREMFYGGMILQWFGRTNETFGYSAKMLMGGGTSESTDVVRVEPRPCHEPDGMVPAGFLRLRAGSERARPLHEEPPAQRRRRLPLYRLRVVRPLRLLPQRPRPQRPERLGRQLRSSNRRRLVAANPVS